MLEATAKLNYLKMAPRKVRLIADSVRGLSVGEAEAQLLLRPARAAKPLLKLLRSCVANAKVKKMDANKLFVGKITVDTGPMMKRFLPRAQGRATPIQKKMSHVVLILQESAVASAPRFTVLKREPKKPSAKGTKKTKVAPKAVQKETPKTEKVGFFRKLFRRKSI